MRSKFVHSVYFSYLCNPFHPQECERAGVGHSQLSTPLGLKDRFGFSSVRGVSESLPG